MYYVVGYKLNVNDFPFVQDYFLAIAAVVGVLLVFYISMLTAFILVSKKLLKEGLNVRRAIIYSIFGVIATTIIIAFMNTRIIIEANHLPEYIRTLVVVSIPVLSFNWGLLKKNTKF